MKAKFLLTVAAVLGFAAVVHAQTTIKGKVINAQGQHIPDINVSALNRTTKTDRHGFFKLYIPGKASFDVVFTGVGYRNYRVKIKRKTDKIDLKNVLMEKVEQPIDQVRVMGYNSVNKQTIALGKGAIVSKDLPQAVQIINAQVIADQQVNTLGDALKNANGIAIGTNRGSVGESFFARGMRMSDNDVLKNGATNNIDANIEASTLESVEILKGSAALLYGGVSGGAVVNLVTKKPKFELGSELSLRYGSWGRYKPMLDVYGPLSKRIAFRLVSTGESAGSFRDYVKTKRAYMNPSLLYKLSEHTSINFMFDYLKANFTPDFGIGTLDGKINKALSRSTYLNVPWAFNRTNSTNIQVSLDHSFSKDWKMSVLLSQHHYGRNYYSSERIRPGVDSMAALTLRRMRWDETSRNQQVNITGRFTTARFTHQVLIGGDMDQATYKVYAYDIFGNPEQPTVPTAEIGAINVFKPDIESFGRIPEVSLKTRSTTRVYRYGAFVQDLIGITEKFKVLAGLRFTYHFTPATDLWDYQAGKTQPAALKFNDKAWSPKVAFIYQPLHDLSLYTSYTNSFISNKTAIDSNNVPLGPSLLDQYEIGVKKDLLQGKLSVNVTAYKILNHNLAQNIIKADGKVDDLHKEFSGQTTNDGFELDINGDLCKGLHVIAGYSYSFNRFTKTNDEGMVEGVRIARSTANTANATVFYTVQSGQLKGLKLGGSAFYTGKRFAGWNNTKVNILNNTNRLIPLSGYTTLDLSVGYSIGKLKILVKVGNVTDVFNYVVHENYSVNPITPRDFTTTCSYTF